MHSYSHFGCDDDELSRVRIIPTNAYILCHCSQNNIKTQFVVFMNFNSTVVVQKMSSITISFKTDFEVYYKKSCLVNQ